MVPETTLDGAAHSRRSMTGARWALPRSASQGIDAMTQLPELRVRLPAHHRPPPGASRSAGSPRQKIVVPGRGRVQLRGLARRGFASWPARWRASASSRATWWPFMDWDSHRYLEALLRRPDDGRGPPHGQRPALRRADPLHDQPRGGSRAGRSQATSCPSSRRSGSKFETVKKIVVIRDGTAEEAAGWIAGDHEQAARGRRRTGSTFPALDEKTRRDHLLHHRHHRGPEGRVLHASSARAAHDDGAAPASAGSPSRSASGTTTSTCRSRPMFHVHAWGVPYVATMLGVKQVYPGPLRAGDAPASCW